MLEIALDTEATGLDLYHISRPFMVQIFDGENAIFYEWGVDPLTRIPKIPESDKDEIRDYLERADLIVGQNIKFDIQVLSSIGIGYPKRYYEKTHDTLFASHIIASAEKHDLTTLALKYLRVDILPYENAVEKACKEARSIARRFYKDWVIAKHGVPGMPSVKKSSKEDKAWKADMWLPRRIAQERKFKPNHPWWTVTSKYGTTDTIVTLPIFKRQMEILKEKNLLGVYEERRKLIPVIVGMESIGVTVSKSRLKLIKKEFKEDSVLFEKTCLALSNGKIKKLPKSGSTKEMRSLVFDTWKLPVHKRTKTGEPSLDKDSLEFLMLELNPRSSQYAFISNLYNKRKRDTSVAYLTSYEEFGISDGGDILTLHPQLNPTGQKTLRWSGKSPSPQVVSKQYFEDNPEYKKNGWNNRFCFGPDKGREQWAFDYENIEIRVPAYWSGEQSMIDLFERASEPPYFGSFHLLIFDILHPDKFAQYGVKVKDIFKDTWYQWTKNGDFAVQYGAMEESGTADRAYHVKGAQRIVKEKLQALTSLNNQMVESARQTGLVHTMYDHDVGGAYPIQVPKEYNQYTGRMEIRPTRPLNFAVQSTAMNCTGKSMKRVYNYLMELNRKKLGEEYPTFAQIKKYGYYINLQVHDELDIDMPKGKKKDSNGEVVLKVKELMEESGRDIKVNLSVDYTYHPEAWSKGEHVSL